MLLPGFFHYAQLELNLIFFYQDVFFPVGYLPCIESLINVVNSTPILKNISLRIMKVKTICLLNK